MNQNQRSSANRRLFRDPENKVISGVASGLAAYFGINDPLIIRIGFLALFLGFGIGLIPYLVLWFAVPEAKSSADFLSMRGEEININNIAKNVEDGFKDLKTKIEDISKDFKTRVL